MITLVTGLKNTGKSSYLYNWFCREPVGFGVLSIKRFEGEVHSGYDLLFLPICKKVNLCTRMNESYTGCKEDLVRGNYIFDQSAFDQAYQFIQENLYYKKEPIWLDEIGILEIDGKGFWPIIKMIQPMDIELRLGVRLSCVYEFTRMIENNNFHIIYSTSG